MADPTVQESERFPIPRTAAATSSTACPSCGKSVDPLRADRVAIFGDQFYYFCSADCRDRYVPGSPAESDSAGLQAPPEPNRDTLQPEETLPLPLVSPVTSASPLRQTQDAAIELAPPPAPQPVLQVEPAVESPDRGKLTSSATAEWARPADLGTLLLGLGVLGGVLAMALLLAGDSTATRTARLVVVAVACASVIAQHAMAPRDRSSLHPAVLLAAPIAAVLLAAAGLFLGSERSGSLITLAGVITATTAGSLWVIARAKTSLRVERQALGAALDPEAHRVVGAKVTKVRVQDLRPGEEVVVDEGEVVPVDGTISAGSAELFPWLGSTDVVVRSEGEHVVAGSTVRRGSLRIVVSWSGLDRAWARVAIDPRRRADIQSQMVRFGMLVAERGAPLAAATAALAAFASNLGLLEILAYAVATQATLCTVSVGEIGVLHVARAIFLAQRRGVAYRSAESLDRAAKVSTATFCARGTLLLGEPEVASIEPFGPHRPERVLELVAGAEAGSNQPTATAIFRAARSRNIRPDAVRSPNAVPGLGVTAIASDGQPLVVGSRALMLREHISVAVAERTITDLEAAGRSVLLVALGGRLVGMVGLQDGLRPGARAAVQHLLDVGIEPVLVSGDSRETCEALGRALDIEHVRPEVLPADRGDEVRRLVEGGATVAVIGRSPADDAALSCADVGVSLATAGSGAAEWDVQLASDDVRDASFALRLAHRCRSELRLGQAIAIGMSSVGSLAVALTMIPTPLGPIFGFTGTLAALVRWHNTGT